MEALQAAESIRIGAHHYWLGKEQFDLEQDLYAQWTVFVVEEGTFAYRIGEQSGEAGFGDLVVCPPNQRFHRRALQPLTFHFIHFDWADANGDPGTHFLPAGRIEIADTDRLASCCRYLKRLADRTDPEARFMKQHYLRDLVCLHLVEQSLQAACRAAEPPPGMLQARDYIASRAFGNISMRMLADSLALTPVQLTRRFRSAFGMTPTAYATKLRLDRACRMLENSKLSLDEIALSVGYDNGFYLSRVFSKHMGMSPSAYRRTRLV